MTPAKRTQTYLVMAHLGFLATFGFGIATILGWPDFVRGLMIGMLLIPLVVLPLRGMRDEYIEGLWHAGTGWAFIAMVAGFLFAPFLEGFLDGFLEGFTGNASGGQDITPEASGYAAILAFFVGFHLKWLRGQF